MVENALIDNRFEDRRNFDLDCRNIISKWRPSCTTLSNPFCWTTPKVARKLLLQVYDLIYFKNTSLYHTAKIMNFTKRDIKEFDKELLKVLKRKLITQNKIYNNRFVY